MSEWNVYTVGNIEFIYNIFNSVAMLLNDGTYGSLFRISALIGVICVVLAAAISAGKSLSLSHMCVAVVMYYLFFSVSMRTNIEDVTTGKFRAVDNVPAGLAVAASVLSTVGYATTEKMEQAFSVPSMTEYGSLDPLFTLATLYDTLKTPMRWTGQTGAYGDLDASVSNYVKNCVGNDIIRGSKTFASMYRSNQGVSGLASNDSFQRVVIYDNVRSGWSTSTEESSNGGSLYTCSDAYTKLKGLATQNASSLDSAFASSYTASGRTCGGAPCSGSGKAQEVLNFFNISGTDIRDFQLMLVMYPHFRELPMYGLESSFRGTAAVTRAQTMTQQAFQWSSSGSSFLSWMGSFMPIFQGIIYALAPFMAFLFGLGIMGLRLVMKYFLVIIWTWTWLPLAAVVNMYVLNSIRDTSSQILVSSGSGGLSFAQLYQLLFETQKSIGLAGNLYAMIPALGGFIVWGSSVAFNSLASSAAAPSAADTKTLAPDVTNAPAINSRGSDVEFNPTQGTIMGGSSGTLPAIDMKKVATHNLASAKQELDSASSSLTAQSGAMISQVASNMNSGGHSQVYSDASNAAFASLSSSDRALVSSVAKEQGISDMQALVSIAKGDVSVGGGAGSSSAGVGVKGGMSRSEAESSGLSNDNSAKYGSTDSASSHKIDSATQSRIVNTAASAMYQSLSQEGESSQSTRSFAEANQRMQSAQKNFQEANSFVSSTSMGQTMNAAQLATAIGRNHDAQATLTQTLAAHPELSSKIAGDAASLTSLGMTHEDAHTFAQFKAASELGVAGAVAAKAGFINADSSPVLTTTASEQYRGVSGGAESAGGRAVAGAADVGNSVNAVTGRSYGALGEAHASSSDGYGQGQVNTVGGQNSGAVEQIHKGNEGEVMTKAGNTAANDFENNHYNLGGITGDFNKLVSHVSNAFKESPVYEQVHDQARTIAGEIPLGGDANREAARDSIVNYYAMTKAGASEQQLSQARSDMMARIQLATGGENDNGTVMGGNTALARGIAARIDNAGLDRSANDGSIIQQATTALNTDRQTHEYNTGGMANNLGGMHQASNGGSAVDDGVPYAMGTHNQGYGEAETMTVNAQGAEGHNGLNQNSNYGGSETTNINTQGAGGHSDSNNGGTMFSDPPPARATQSHQEYVPVHPRNKENNGGHSGGNDDMIISSSK